MRSAPISVANKAFQATRLGVVPRFYCNFLPEKCGAYYITIFRNICMAFPAAAEGCTSGHPPHPPPGVTALGFLLSLLQSKLTSEKAQETHFVER
jgi:hypothetical protein